MSSNHVPVRRSTSLEVGADMTIQRGCQFYCIHYYLVGSRTNDVDVDSDPSPPPPIVVLHGGPGVPSNYLRPLQDAVKQSRELLFWDQLGCGKSDRPDDPKVCSIDLYVNDLVQLLEEVLGNSKKFHLYGQSFGGILAFEYLKRERPTNCLSVVLSSTPTNVQQVEAEANRLTMKLLITGTSKADLTEAFRKKHQVQTEVRPKPLEDALAAAGTIFRGTSAIADYKASLGTGTDTDMNDAEASLVETPAMIIRGEHDFVTLPCIEGWEKFFRTVTIHELEGCSHHGLLECPDEYGRILESFWQAREK